MALNMDISGGLGAGELIIATAGTVLQLDTSTDGSQLWRSIVVRAKNDNTGRIVIGNRDLGATSWPNDGLAADEQMAWESLSGNAVDLAQIYIDAATSGDGVDFWVGK